MSDEKDLYVDDVDRKHSIVNIENYMKIFNS